jgi:hypothetical protein
VCSSNGNCPDILCSDTSCQVPDNACLIWCLRHNALWILTNSTQEQCESQAVCNWDSTLCAGLDATDCEAQCNDGTSFCGVCEDGQNCYDIGADSEEACQASTVCILPNGTIAVNISDAECNSYTQCSTNCPPKCTSSLSFGSNGMYKNSVVLTHLGVCFSTSLTYTQCTQESGTFDNSTSVCYFTQITSASSCNATFQSCQDLAIYDCIQCQYTDDCKLNQIAMQCFVDNNVQCNETECAQAGVCSDAEVLQNWDASVPIYGDLSNKL